MSDRSPTADEARELAESSRESEWSSPSFAAELFLGRFRPELVFPFPEQDAADRASAEPFLVELDAFLREHVDAAKHDREEEIPREVLQGLVDMGAFGMKIPKEYGGLGFSQLNYNRAVALVASHCASTAVWLSAHQSIGVPQPLRLFGTEAQKREWLPKLATGTISGFALTEPQVGSDPANMATTATPSADGTHWILSGEKLWCTNGLASDVLVVMARTPSKFVNGKERKQVSAFLVDMKSPGIERTHKCRFLGIRAISNGVIRFKDVRVPAENLLGGEGRGLKIALVTLNTGRLTLPAAAVGVGKQCLQISRRWAGERAQWGRKIGEHEAVAAKLAWIASHVFAMEAVSDYASGLAARGGRDIRLEAAMAKLFGSETLARIVDMTLQIRGGRGYEREQSLAGRGEIPFPVERIFRDARINTIVEGTTDIMHLFIAREALDPHLKKAGALVDAHATPDAKTKALAAAMTFYPGWYVARWWPFDLPPRASIPAPLQTHIRFVQRASRRLARSLFHAMVTVGPALERRQETLARFVDAGTELMAIAVTVSRAASRAGANPSDASPVELADHFARVARGRVEAAFRGLRANDDVSARRVAKSLLEKRYAWLEEGILAACPEEAAATPETSAGPHGRVLERRQRERRTDPAPRSPSPTA